ncbi:MAG TPA: O-antigen ligase domain-containing protein [Candidatus Hydrogenedentes bacterium]|nr:O-antigen ligase domain-containing protein [Candidatus Hydrogenedentota bacterium]HRK34138.1 O-antigen ligase domain-containing protein [Candidatus Hydrogenedentota bacterium]
MTHPPDSNFLVPLVMFGWPFVLVAMFMMMPSRRAVIVGLITAWLFLPVAEYQFRGIPEYNKMTATSISLFLATLFFDPTRVLSFRPKWIDLPMLIVCFCPLASSLTNGLGLYDGLSESNGQLMKWGLPYFLGRVYFTDYQSMRELAVGVFIGGLIYLPFCWFEMRMSPQLHRMTYGYHQHAFVQTIRMGGYRPMIFLQHGLMVGMWMTTATLCGLALWQTKVLTSIRGIPMWMILSVLGVTTIMCRSTGAILLLMAGVGVFITIRYMRTSLGLVALAGVCAFYIAVRAFGIWDGSEMIDATNSVFGAERAQSVATRVYNEEALTQKARIQPVFGWGGWGRSRIHNESGKDITITDSQWVITLGANGLLGMTAMLAAVLLPAILLARKVPPAWWNHPVASPVAALAVVVVLWMADNTMNAMFNPVYVVIIGGLAGLRPLSQLDLPSLAVRRVVTRRPHVPRRKKGRPVPPRAQPAQEPRAF